MSGALIERLADGRELHRLREVTPVSLSRPRRTWKAPIGDDAIMGRTTMRTRSHDLTAMLIDEEVPIAGHTDVIGGGMIGVPFEEFPRRAGPGADMTHLLREADVPMTPARKRGKPFGLQADEDEASPEDERELYMAEDEDEDEDGEDEGGEEEDESRRLTEEEARDDLCDYIEAVAGDTHATSRGLLTLAGLLRRQRRAGHAAAGMLG